MSDRDGLLAGIRESEGSWGLRAVGVLLGAVFFGVSLTPSLMPRDPTMQGALGGVVAILGYWIAMYGVWLWRFLGFPVPAQSRRRTLRLLATAIALLICVAFLWRATGWQNATRDVMGLDPVDTTHPWTVGGIALAVFVALLLLGRAFGFVLWRLDALLGRLVPPRVGVVLGFGLVLWLFWAAIDGVLVRRIFEAADASFEAADVLIEPDIPQPSDPQKTGSPDSLVRWQEMGRWGRSFVANAPTASEILEFAGEEARDPVRVYVGRRAADTPDERAKIALDELIRVRGFERSAIVVVVPVGTGWMDPGGHDTLDFMLGGDVATVAVQYSYLTSALSLLAHPENGIEQARALFDTIYTYWSALPKENRPKLYVHGLSQGAFNSQSTLPLLDILADPIDGALWAGSPFLSPTWQHIRDDRNPESPAWRPRFGNGSLARVTNQEDTLDDGFSPWGPIRLVFLHYGSDAIVSFTFDSAWRRPDWMKGERPFDVSEDFRWFPVVTMFHLALDMAISLKVPRYGHFYVAPDYIDAWAEVVQPEGWNDDRAAALKAIFERRPAPW
ncbi:alpha/beta hydrolase [Tropicimonas marinistellae]|uniref:alpha/beta hydrolase n=1 Tax=Tropicimonas marinistellae TaxID=1739787 RepID=UPI00083610E2|nr:alpha/beta-hydrolase family protein [Tropicimonas marinistellae]